MGHRPTDVQPGLFQPMLCVVLQGAKEVTIGDRTLRYHPAQFNGWYFLPALFYGDGVQMFSDRVWSEPPPQGGLFGVQHPFSPYATDKLRVSFNIVLFLNGAYGDLTYALLSWGNASSTVTPQCQGNYMYAFLNDQMLTFTFKKVSATIPH